MRFAAGIELILQLDSLLRILYSVVIERAILAQLVERVTCNLEVLGSIPGDGFTRYCKNSYNLERFPSGQRGQTVNLLA